MAGVLLTAGPIATRKSVNGMSRTFRFLVTAAKFEAAANKLQANDLGQLMGVPGANRVFIKKPPALARSLLQSELNAGLCVTPEEYQVRYYMPTPASVSSKIKESVVSQGLVPRELFEVEEEGQPEAEGNLGVMQL